MHRQVGRPMLQRLEAFPGHRRDELHLDVRPIEEKALVQVGRARRNVAGEELAPHFVVRIDRARHGVVLVDAHHVLALDAAGLEHLVEVGEDALRFQLVLRQSEARRRRVDYFSAFVAGGEQPAPGAHAGGVAHVAWLERHRKKRARRG